MRNPEPAAAAIAERRPVRSYVRREGRLTRAQAQAIERLLPAYMFPESDAAVDLPAVFGRRAHTVLEIGFGNGDALAELAAAHPERNYIGVEVHRPGIGRLLMRLEREDISNVRVASRDAALVLRNEIPDDALDEILIYFPDPWPKKRHHKRRLVQVEFALLLSAKLAVGGVVELATDWPDYAEQMRLVLDATPGLEKLAAGSEYVPTPRPHTRFAAKGESMGYAVHDLAYRRVA